jgi:hypothetical protein
LNSLTAVTMEDFVSSLVKIPEERYVGISKYVLLAWGVLTLVFGFFAGKLAATAIEAINKIGSVCYGPILGIFLLTTIPRVTPLAANVAAATGVGVNIILWLFFPNVFWFWWNAIGALVTLGVGTTLGFILTAGRSRQAAPAVTVARPFPLRESIVMLAMFLVILALCLLLPRVASAAPDDSLLSPAGLKETASADRPH